MCYSKETDEQEVLPMCYAVYAGDTNIATAKLDLFREKQNSLPPKTHLCNKIMCSNTRCTELLRKCQRFAQAGLTLVIQIKCHQCPARC